MSTSTDTDKAKALAPPYTAYQSLKSLIAAAHEHGAPPGRYDKTVLSNFSWAVASQLLTALKFLGLTDDVGIPTPRLERLIQVYGTDDWRAEITDTIKSAYAPLFSLNLETATPGQFNEKFKDAYQGEGETLRKGVTFFLNAAKDAGIPVSGYIMKGKKTRSAPAKKRQKSNGVKGVPAAGHGNDDTGKKDTQTDTGEHGHKKRKLPGLIAALVESLPGDGETWSLDDAADWLQTAAYNFRYAYRLPGILNVTITPVVKGGGA